ncbi:CBS domain-containing protein [Halomonas nitroreducens]|uniref:CBS domain-containing protein n=1 Tax=Halomonas nitroreducens TaxID=447425 RepID=A0A3S0HPI0_9GAMM|nr:CBS domain-containing protein [Halomonas nitroreducens]RTR02927.1 CBS domain-containing protein [Halomonas nitroreducens]
MTTLTSSPERLEALSGHPLIVKPVRTRLSPDSPALTVLTDFSLTPPLTISVDTPILDARKVMQHGGVRLLLVVDDLKRCLGVLTAREVIGGRRTTQAMQNRALPRAEVTAGMVQTPCQELRALSMERLANLTIGQLMRDLESFGDQHLLVTERDRRHGLQIRGVISAADIGRALGTDMSTVPEARSFADICRVVLGHDL